MVGTVMPGLSQPALLSPSDPMRAQLRTKLSTDNRASAGAAASRTNRALCKCLLQLV